MKRVLLLVALLVFPIAAFANIPGVYCYGPGQCIPNAKAPDSNTNAPFTGSTLGYPNPWLNSSGQNQPPASPTPVINVYIVWANSTVNATWSPSQQQVVAEILGAYGASDWWKWLSIYPRNYDMGLSSTWPPLQLVNCFSGSPAHCTTATYVPPGSGGGAWPGAGFALISSAVSGGQLPNDGQAIYMALPSASDTDTGSWGGFGPSGSVQILSSRGIGGDCETGVVGQHSPIWYLYNGLSGPSHLNGGAGAGPNNDCGFDDLLFFMNVEINNTITGWGFNCGLGETTCNNTSFPGAFTNPQGNIANFAVTDGPTTYYAFLPGGVYAAQGGAYGVGATAPPFFWNTHCESNADCPAFSNKCGTGVNRPLNPYGDTRGNHCLAPSNYDGIKNGYETDTDCGTGVGSFQAPNALVNQCVDGQHCAVDTDCNFFVGPGAGTPSCCVAGICQAQVAPCTP